MIASSAFGRALQYHIANKGLDSARGESILSEAWGTLSSFVSQITPIEVAGVGATLLLLFVFWNLVGKGTGSHAGREEVRRAYRRKLAQEMAKEDAEKIRRGEKPRRRWMQW